MLFLTSNLRIASNYYCLVPAIDGKGWVAAFLLGVMLFLPSVAILEVFLYCFVLFQSVKMQEEK